ncbi:MAG: MerR family transcriptional regulator [Thiothrix sp.]|jgi:DNA-binding transcriptional MerR regulator|nr:MAG: MerR family transcriptional regulator [Thiothrix sp.]
MQETQIPNSELPAIPSKRYFTIGEVSDLCCVKAYILRYWEQEFPSLKPMKRRGNRRYYQREDVLMIRQIRGLLYEEGYTISGARQKLLGSSDEPVEVSTEDLPPATLEQVIQRLENVLVTLKS